MWLMTSIGFFSIVEKHEDRKDGMVTIRARVLGDLEALRLYLPKMGLIVTSENSDYRYRVRAHKVDAAYALLKITMTVDYTNFKDQVLRVQGHERANTYMGVWAKLRDLQFPSATGNF